MHRISSEKNRDLLFLISEMCQAARFCRQDSVFCDGITFSQFLILDALANRGTLKMADLHAILGVEKSTTTRLAKPLVDRNLIQKTTAAGDQRTICLSLTPDGRERYERVWHCFMGFADTVREKIPEEERRQVYSALKTFLKAIRTASSACPCECTNDIRG